MRHFVSRNLLNQHHDYQSKIREYKKYGIIPEKWRIEREKNTTYYMMATDNRLSKNDDFIELVWYQLEEEWL